MASDYESGQIHIISRLVDHVREYPIGSMLRGIRHDDGERDFNLALLVNFIQSFRPMKPRPAPLPRDPETVNGPWKPEPVVTPGTFRTWVMRVEEVSEVSYHIAAPTLAEAIEQLNVGLEMSRTHIITRKRDVLQATRED